MHYLLLLLLLATAAATRVAAVCDSGSVTWVDEPSGIGYLPGADVYCPATYPGTVPLLTHLVCGGSEWVSDGGEEYGPLAYCTHWCNPSALSYNQPNNGIPVTPVALEPGDYNVPPQVRTVTATCTGGQVSTVDPTVYFTCTASQECGLCEAETLAGNYMHNSGETALAQWLPNNDQELTCVDAAPSSSSTGGASSSTVL